jgi:pSer/pThr/pTyr-binding forkhead associated (FHA) protein
MCPYCTVTDVKVSELTDKLHLQHGGDGAEVPTAFLVDLVSNRKIPITTPRCKVGRDDLNDIVISGDQSISRFHFVISKDSDQYMVQDSKSRHGTFLNGNQIAGPIPINDGDVLKVGVSLFWFVIENQTVGAPDQFSPVDVPADAQEMKVSAGEKTTPYAPTREVDVASMTSLKEVLAQAKAKENAASEAEMSKTMPPNYKELAEEKLAPKSEDKSDKADEKAEKSESKSNEKSDEKSDDKSEVKSENKSDEKSDAKSDNKSDEKSDAKDSQEDTEGKDSKAKEEKEQEEKESAKKDENKSEKKEDKKEDGMQITASMLMEALEHESLSEVSKLDDAPKGKNKESEKEVSGNGKEKSEDAESKDKEKEKDKEKDKEKGKKKKDDDLLSEKDLQGLFSDNNLDKTTDKEAASDNNKDHDESSSDKISDSPESADKEPEDKSKGNDEDFSPGVSDKSQSDTEAVSKSTLDKMADAVQDSSESKEKELDKEDKTEEKASSSNTEEAGSLSNLSFEQEIVEKTKNGAWSGNTMQDTKVPDWCSKYFASELNLLVKDLDTLNEQVRTAQNKIKEVENRLAATKSLRNTLLTSTGEDLVEACGKVLARLGFRVKIVEDDKQELRLESDDKVSICRIIWTPGLPERTHLGQLSIAQTRYWCEQGAEPKGILIAAQAEDKPPPKITDTDYNGELADYASKKNVLMFTTLQLLAMYKEVALNDGSSESLRSSIHTSNGWLKGYSLDPSDEDEKEPGKLASASA